MEASKCTNVGFGECKLSSDCFWVEVPVSIGDRVWLTGLIRNDVRERIDASLIFFDFDGYRPDVETLKLLGLKSSKVGIFSYLPSEKGLNSWSFLIPINEDIGVLKVGFRTWKSLGDVFLNKNIDIKKDFFFKVMKRNLDKKIVENRELNREVRFLRNKVDSIYKSSSYELGRTIVGLTKSYKNIFLLPSNLWRVMKIYGALNKNRCLLRKSNVNWINLSKSDLSYEVKVQPKAEIVLSGKIITQEFEKKNAALVLIEFCGGNVSPDSAKRLGLQYSDNVGFYKYLPTTVAGEHSWKVSLIAPKQCNKIKIAIQKWYSSKDIYVSLDKPGDDANTSKKLKDSCMQQLSSLFDSHGVQHAERFIRDSESEPYSKADMYESLADKLSIQNRGRFYLLAYQEDPSYLRAVKMFRRIVDAGLLDTAKVILEDFERQDYNVQQTDLRNLNYARGYVALFNRLPQLPNNLVIPLEENSRKVLMFLHTSLPHHSNGYATRSHAILTSLLKTSEYSVDGITRSGYPFDVGIKTFENHDLVDGVSYSRLSAAHYYDQPMDDYIKTAADEVEKLLFSKKPSVVHSASAFYTALPALIAARRQGISFVYEVRGLWEITRASTLPGWGETERFTLESDLETLVAKEADQVVAITKGLKDELIRRGVSEQKITIIPNAINKDHFKPLNPNKVLRKKIGLKNVPTIGYVGSIVDYEGLDDLVEALSLLKRDGIAFNFLLIGDGNALPGIRQKVSSLKLENDVFVLGRIPHNEVQEHYSLIDITPFPRKPLQVCEMVSPLKPFEAMAQKKTVIASNVGALQEIIQDGKTGLLFEKGSVEDLAAKLSDVLKDGVLRSKLAEKGKSWVLANRDWSQVVRRFDDVYDRAFAINHERMHSRIEEVERIRPLSLLVYGDLNLNYVDGSAIWACSLVEMLSGLKNVSVTFLLKAELTHDTLIESLKKLDNVTVVSPSTTFLKSKLLKPEQAIEVLEQLQLENNYDGVVLRGFELNKRAAEKKVFVGRLWPYLIDVFHIKGEWTEEITEDVKKVVEASYTVFCQTTYIQDFLEEKVSAAKGKTSLLPPMVPDQLQPKMSIDTSGRTFRIVYAGKFAPLWGTREMLSTFSELRRRGNNVELHVYGDKIHNPPEDPTFKKEVEEALSNTEGLIWHKARPRAEVIEALRIYDLAWAWRRPELEENTDEVSTKFLEYSSVGLPMLVIGNKITTKLLGKSYPLFVNAFEDLIPVIESVLADDSEIKLASSLVYDASKAFSFSAVRANYIDALVSPLRSRGVHKTILFAGHDLKFVDRLMDMFAGEGYRVLVDKWQGHNKHDEVRSRELLKRADTIFCEWCLGNAVWYSQNKLPYQKMFIRYHRQEIETEYPAQVNYPAVEKMAFIVPHMQRKTIAQYALERYADKFVYIPNYVETKELDRPKTEDARFNIGIVGIVPRMKRFDRALDILEELRKKDKRYQLFVKGKVAKEYPWMLNRSDEMQYYEKQESRINQSPYLKGAVHYDGFSKDMGSWFSKIGYILSTSDFEGSHLSVAEAMGSGSTPVIIKWDGADEIYPSENCFDSIPDAVDHILKETDTSFSNVLEGNKAFVDVFDLEKIHCDWKKLI